ncbi:MAG: aldolase catalytic domain-containing protein [Verrucomicrobia bacterium]|nr:aldolase catalytic domain-containing protein [Verrucomicrobiota bacterium]MDA1086947.1 aldolase catalytic domain-containing protein [Verrucomicrobiota bacterium]
MKDADNTNSAEMWVSYRSDLEVLDCTIRDGGLMNDHRFDDETVRAVYQTCVAAGIDYMEIGYMNSPKQFPREDFGPWKHSAEEDLRRIVGENDTALKLCVMADAEKCEYEEQFLPAGESVIDMIRVATYIHQIPTALEMLRVAKERGYETCCNIMALSTLREPELREGLDLVVQSGIKAVCIVDSFGALYREQIDYYYDLYHSYAEPHGVTVGIHAHNNLQLGFANTVEAIIKGAGVADATMAGLGRGAGNCPMELLMGFLHNPKYHHRPVIECVSKVIEPMRESLKWGFDLPYMMTAILNRHPRAAMSFKDSDESGDVVGFYDRMLDGV